jgi:FixJ family two-component response regulator
MNEVEAIVFTVDDDLSFRRSTEHLVRSAGFNVLMIPNPTRD